MILPGSTLGLLGGGQLGRMFTSAARTMGYDVIVLDPDPLSPAAHFATEHICADFNDQRALEQLATRCAAVTTEFENPPAESLAWLAERIPVRPGANAVAIAQDRVREKQFFAENNFPVGPFTIIQRNEDFDSEGRTTQFPAILKNRTIRLRRQRSNSLCNNSGSSRSVSIRERHSLCVRTIVTAQT